MKSRAILWITDRIDGHNKLLPHVFREFVDVEGGSPRDSSRLDSWIAAGWRIAERQGVVANERNVTAIVLERKWIPSGAVVDG